MSSSYYRHPQPKKRKKRPWEKGIASSSSSTTSSSLPFPTHSPFPHKERSDTNKIDDDKDQKENVPYVTLEGVKYYSDRFYLNSTSHTNTSSPRHTTPKCSCQTNTEQEGKQPPLFNHTQFISSLDLIGVIAATYTIDVKWMHREFSFLEERNVPTLILHGHKGLKNPDVAAPNSGSKVGTTEETKHGGDAQHVTPSPPALNKKETAKKASNPNNNSTTFEFCKLKKKTIEIISIDDDDDEKCCVDNNPPSKKNSGKNTSISIQPRQTPQKTMASSLSLPNHKSKRVIHTYPPTTRRKSGDVCNPKRRRNNTKIRVMNPILYDVQNADTDDENEKDETNQNDDKRMGGNKEKRMGDAISPMKKEEVFSRSGSGISVSSMLKQERNILSAASRGISTGKHVNSTNDTDNNETLKNQEQNLKEWFEKNAYLTKILATYMPLSSVETSPSSEKRKNTDCNSNKQNLKAKTMKKDDRNVIVIDSSSDDDDDNNGCGKKEVTTNKKPTTSSSLPKKADNENTHDKNHKVNSTSRKKEKHPQQQRKATQGGVHHPKYFLLFEKSGSLVVIVSTSNLTEPFGSVDASWVQRFEPRHRHSFQDDDNDCEEEGFIQKNDFGQVLTDFLQRQSDAAAPTDGNNHNSMKPQEFLRRYIGIPSLCTFGSRFKFEDASVYLVSTVPGCHFGRFGLDALVRRGGSGGGGEKRSRRQQQMLYGPQRVSDILSKLSNVSHSSRRKRETERQWRLQTSKNADGMTRNDNHYRSKNKPWFSRGFLSQKDRLILQTTSLGGNWTHQELVRVAQSYMGENHRGHHFPPPTDKRDRDNKSVSRFPKEKDAINLINSIDIIWPSMDFVNQANKQCQIKLLQEKHKSHKRNNGTSDDDKSKYVTNEIKDGFFGGGGGSTFLSSTTFNTLDLSCISRMALYDTSGKPDEIPWTLPPHIKTFGRLLHKTDDDGDGLVTNNTSKKTMTSANNMKEEDGTTTVEKNKPHLLAWIMLTSACLSGGAQGKAVKERSYNSDEMSYSNFELGVLFCSRVQGISSSDRMYGWDPNYCNVCRSSQQVQVHVESSAKAVPWNKDSRPMVMTTKKKVARLIHLPIPYNLHPPMYQEDEEDVDMWTTPYFHEIPNGTGCIGQMKLTPLGKMLASRSDH